MSNVSEERRRRRVMQYEHLKWISAISGLPICDINQVRLGGKCSARSAEDSSHFSLSTVLPIRGSLCESDIEILYRRRVRKISAFLVVFNATHLMEYAASLAAISFQSQSGTIQTCLWHYTRFCVAVSEWSRFLHRHRPCLQPE